MMTKEKIKGKVLGNPILKTLMRIGKKRDKVKGNPIIAIYALLSPFKESETKGLTGLSLY